MTYAISNKDFKTIKLFFRTEEEFNAAMIIYKKELEIGEHRKEIAKSIEMVKQ